MKLFNDLRHMGEDKLSTLAKVTGGLALLIIVAVVLSGNVGFLPQSLRLALQNINGTHSVAAVAYWQTQQTAPNFGSPAGPAHGAIFPACIGPENGNAACQNNGASGGWLASEVFPIGPTFGVISISDSAGHGVFFSDYGGCFGGYNNGGCGGYWGSTYTSASTVMTAPTGSALQLDWACQPGQYGAYFAGSPLQWIPFHVGFTVTNYALSDNDGEMLPTASGVATYSSFPEQMNGGAGFVTTTHTDTTNPQALYGSTTVHPVGAPGSTVTYTLNCVNASYAATPMQVSVVISKATMSISANPQNVPSGQTSQITWSANNIVPNSCTVTGPSGVGTIFNGSVGQDSSPNKNDFTPNNMSPYDQVVDTPTNSFANLNQNYYYSPSYSKGTVQDAGLSANGNYGATSGFQMTSGKWYWENTVAGGGTGGYPVVGVFSTPSGGTANRAFPGYINDTGFGYSSAAPILYSNGAAVSTTLPAFTNGDVIGVAYDAATGNVYFSKNGNWNGANPAGGTGAVGSVMNGFPGLASYYGKTFVNFGQGGQGGLTYDAASGGYFKYAPPAGFKALSTTNLPTPAIAKPNTYFDAKTYTGNAAPQTAAFTYTGTVQTFTVPPGVTSLNVKEWGGAGGTWALNYMGGGGGYTGGTITVTPGQTLSVVVGGGGSGTGGFGGGGNPAAAYDGGGGYSGIFNGACTVGGTCDASNALLIAGGGGGGAQCNSTGMWGGAGGGATGQTAPANTYAAGGGGTQTSGGASVGGAGTAFQGGTAGGNGACTGGGGGGGYYGGGAGYYYSPGGGGSGYCGGSGVSACTTTTGSANTPGNNTDPALPSGYAFGVNVAGATGQNGYVVITYSPSLISQNISSFNFQPNLVWIKDRGTTNWNALFDSVRGALKSLFTNNNGVQTTSDTNGYLSTFLSNGFTVSGLGNDQQSNVNASGNNYVAWAWRKSATDGVDIETYTGNGALNRNITLTQSIGGAPDMVIVKRTDAAATDWYVWHSSLTGPTYFTELDQNYAQSPTQSPWGTGNFSSTQFMVTHNAVNDLNTNGGTYVAYLFKGVDGFSKFGSYVGNGQGPADGTFIYTGFKPKYVMIKRVDTTGNWVIHDSARNPSNPTSADIFANITDAETSQPRIDFVSNGFKFVNSGGDFNDPGYTYIYAAFAEEPFALSAGATGGYSLANSLRFSAANSAYLSRTPSVSGDTKKATFSVWIKRGAVGTSQMILNQYNSGGGDQIRFESDNTLTVLLGGGTYSVHTASVFRDPSAWMHLVVSIDLTQASPNNIQVYVNGVQQTLTGTFPIAGYSFTGWNQATVPNLIGQYSGGSWAFDGYMADVYAIDGQVLTPSSFGVADANGYWRPKAYAGTYGTNGFHLNFAGSPTSFSNAGSPYTTPTVTALNAPQVYTLSCSAPEGGTISVQTSVGLLAAGSPSGTLTGAADCSAAVGTATDSDGGGVAPSSGLVGNWSFDAAQTNWGANTTNDSSGNSYTASLVSLTSAASVPGQIAEALNLNGTSQYAKVTNPAGLINIGSTMSISAWIKLSSSNGTYREIARFQGNAGGWFLLLNLSNKLAFTSSQALAEYTNGFTYTDTTNWHLVTATFDGTTIRMYLDGVPQISYPGGPIVTNTSGSLGIGALFGGGQNFPGSIDDLRIYNRALSAAEVTQLYNTATAPQVGFYADGPWGGVGTFLGSTTASGGVFNFPINASFGLNDGNPHTLYAYIRNNPSTPGTDAQLSPFMCSKPPTVTITKTADASEGGGVIGAAGTPGTFVVTRTGLSSVPITVNFTTTGTAVPNGVDFQNFGTSVVIPAGSASKSVTVSVSPRLNDIVQQGVKTLIVNLTANVAYILGSPNTATMNINDDDSVPPTITSSAGLGVVCATGATPAASCRIRKNSTATLSWTVSGLLAGMSCGITSSPAAAAPTIQNWTTDGNYSVASNPITAPTTFTLTCGSPGLQTSDSASVTLVPGVQEI